MFRKQEREEEMDGGRTRQDLGLPTGGWHRGVEPSKQSLAP